MTFMTEVSVAFGHERRNEVHPGAMKVLLSALRERVAKGMRAIDETELAALFESYHATWQIHRRAFLEDLADAFSMSVEPVTLHLNYGDGPDGQGRIYVVLFGDMTPEEQEDEVRGVFLRRYLQNTFSETLFANACEMGVLPEPLRLAYHPPAAARKRGKGQKKQAVAEAA